MKMLSFALGVALGLGAAGAAVAVDQTVSVTGEVSDAMCGTKHMMPGSAAECVKACAGQGSKYALVVGGKVYTLATDDQATQAKLDQLAGAKASVTGTVHDDTIRVSSVTSGK